MKALLEVGHFHSAGVPGRHELYTGELDYRNITRKIDELGYKGNFGVEYFPLEQSEESLKKTKKYLFLISLTGIIIWNLS